MHRRYPILRAEKIISCSGSLELFTLREDVDNFIQVLLHVADINNKVVTYNLTFKGLCNCSGSQSVVLAIGT